MAPKGNGLAAKSHLGAISLQGSFGLVFYNKCNSDREESTEPIDSEIERARGSF
jgi:hypothetical protein